MLVDIRRNIQKVAAIAIIGLLVLAFASWGIGDYISGFSQIRVATIDGKGITDQAFARARQLQEQRYRNQLGDNYQAGMLDEPLIKMALVQEIIDEHLRISDAKNHGFRVSPEQLSRTITKIEVFRGEDGFDRSLYKQLLQRQGLSIGRFEKDLAESIITDQVRIGLTTSALVADAELQQLLDLQGEQRDVTFLLIPGDQFAGSIEVSDPAIKEFYETHIDRFQTPEQVRIEYLELLLDDYAAAVELDNELLQSLYNEQQDLFRTPEQRQASHLLIEVASDADEQQVAAALKKITALKSQIATGTEFTDLAKENSDDLGSAKNGGDLGLFGKGVMDPEFESAAFALPLNQVSEPVRSAFGYHLIKVTRIELAKTQPLAEVKDEISLRYRREQAEEAFFNATEALQDTVYEQPDSLQPAADQFGLEIKQSELFPRFGGTGITGVSEVIEQAFSESVLNGENSPVVTIENSRAVALRAADHLPPQPKPLAEVSEAIREVLREQLTAEAVASQGKRLLDGLATDAGIDTQLSELSLEWQQREAITRSQPGLPPAMVTELFRLPVTTDGSPEFKGEFKGMSLDNGDYVIYTVTKLHADPLPASDEERKQLQRNVERLRGDIAFIGYLKSLRNAADIKIFPENL